MRGDKRTSLKSETKGTIRGHKRGVTGYSRKTALLEEAITQMNAGKYGRSSSALKELLALDPQNMEARRLFATLHLRLGSLIPARQAFDILITEAFQRQDYWLAESLLREYLAAGPRCVPFLEKLGLIYQEKGDVQEAVAEYGKAIDILIEDPDPDNPQLAPQLYKKIRDLAPASPVAIRLASCFDAQTGELLGREPNHSDAVTESPVVTEEYQAIPEPASGVMPWDIEPSQDELKASPGTLYQADGSISAAPTQESDAPRAGMEAHRQDEQPGDVTIQVQPDRSLGEGTSSQSPELTRLEKDGGELPAHEEAIVSINVRTQEAQSGALSSDLEGEAQAGLLEPRVTEVENRPPFGQGVVEATQAPAEIGPVSTGESSAVQPTTNDESVAARGLTALTQETESAPALHSQVTSIPLSEVVSAVPDGAVGSHTETLRDIPSSGVSGQAAPQSPTEPWKEPGFSWESLFDRAWSFGTLPSASSPEQETIQAKSEVLSISERLHPANAPIESESAQIPDRAESAAFIEEATSTGSIKPLPWDQIQESALPIPPPQVEEPQAGVMATTEGQAASTAQEQSQTESAAVEIPDRAESAAFIEEATSTGSIRPMPWDQIQESVTPIPPAQMEESQAGATVTIEGPSASIVEETPKVETEVVELPERTEREAVPEQLMPTASMSPMPWDQIQESVISIPSAQIEVPHPGVMATAEGEVVSTAQEQSQAESAAVEIPERVEGAAFREEATSTGSIKPMPWDQIQESVIPIPSAQVEEPHARVIDRTEEPSGSTAQEQSPVDSEAIEDPERVDRDKGATELTATASMSPMSQDQSQESVIPIPSGQVEESHVESTVTEEERSTSPASLTEIAEVGQGQSPAAVVLAPAFEETESLTEGSAPAIPSPIELQVNQVEATHSEPEAPSQGVSPQLSLAESQSGGEQPTSYEGTEIAQTLLHPEPGGSSGTVDQADEFARSLHLRLHDVRDLEQESAVPQSSNTRGLEAEPISESQQLREPLSSRMDESDPVEGTTETVLEVPLSSVKERIEQREEATVVPQSVTTDECAEASPTVPESHVEIPQWQTPKPVATSPIEQEVIPPLAVGTVMTPPNSEVVAAIQSRDDSRQEDLVLAESIPKSSESLVHQEEWVKTSETIRFVDVTQESPAASPATTELGTMSHVSPLESVTDDTRFMSSRSVEREEAKEREGESPSRPKVHSERRGIGRAIQEFIGSCFSTTRAIVATCVGLILLILSAVLVGIGLVGLTWVTMEEGPSPAYQSFTTIPQQTLSDFKKNGYFLLVGFDAPAQLDPIQAGYDVKTRADYVARGRACLGDGQGASGQQPNASANVSGSWFRSADPVGQFRAHSDTVRGWASQQASTLSRYGRWHRLPFEDWGYGQTTSLPCTSIIFAHELYVADGFLQAMEEGVERLETDMEAWRIVLGQARTLSVKTLALQAMNDDIAVASGLLVRSDFDSKYLGHLTKMLRPLDQAELSIRWPMQSELVSASKTYEAQIKAAKADDQSVYAVMASMLSLPKQRRLNDYAEYYETSYKAVGEGHHSTLPKWKDYIRTPAAGLSDYVTNPIENIIGLEPLPPWDVYHGQVMDTEARLRLASLQAWLRRGPTDGDVLTRLAKAGQKFYDPYTGLPMLVNMKKAALYSVGHDGKDHDADPRFDVVVTIPAVHAHSTQSAPKPSAESSRP